MTRHRFAFAHKIDKQAVAPIDTMDSYFSDKWIRNKRWLKQLHTLLMLGWLSANPLKLYSALVRRVHFICVRSQVPCVLTLSTCRYLITWVVVVSAILSRRIIEPHQGMYSQSGSFAVLTVNAGAAAVGITRYSNCLKLPELSERMSSDHAPCGEGSATGQSLSYARGIRKAFMVFYSPLSYDREPALAITDRLLFQRHMDSAIERCLRRNWHSLFNLRAFGDCIVSKFREPPGYTGIRGMAVIPLPLPDNDGNTALVYGITGPSGQVVVAPIKMARSDQAQPFFPEFPSQHRELCLIFGVPLALEAIG